MTVKLFVLGLPGSGKSTVARYISTYAGDMGWKTMHINDYAILKGMFDKDKDSDHKQFKPADNGGFDILDHTVFDTALQRLEQEVNQHLLSDEQKEIVLIEFARNDYVRAFQQFNDAFLQDAFFLYLEAEISTCKVRIRNRINNPICEDDYNVSEYIFETYYQKDDGKELSDILDREYKVDQQQVRIIDNNCSLEVASRNISPLIDTVIDSKSACADKSARPENLFV